MKRMPLSERFSCIKAVTVDSTESETEFSDNDLIPRSSSNRFNYSNTAILSFTENTVHKTLEVDLEDSDEEIFDMEDGWKEHFHKVLLKNRNLSSEHGIHTISLCDKVPQIDNSLPLQCLKNSLDQYNKLSQGSEDVYETLTTDDLTIERNETGMDICEDNNICEIDSENVVTQVGSNDKENIENSVNTNLMINDAHAFKMEKQQITEPVQGDVLNNEIDIDKTEEIAEPVPVNNFKTDTNADKDYINTESVQIDKKLKQELEVLRKNKSVHEPETPCIKDPGFKTENVVVSEKEKVETRNETIENSREISSGSNQVPKDTAERTNVLETSNACPLNIQENEMSLSYQLLKDNQHNDTRKTEKTGLSQFSDENSLVTGIVYQERSTEVLNEVETFHNSNLSETKSDEKRKDVSVKLHDSFASPKNKEKKQNKSLTHPDTKTKNVALKCNQKKLKNTSFSQSKEPKKIKTIDIKPTFSFPLDELLPPAPTKKRKASEDFESTVETVDVARKRHTSETNKTKQHAVPEEMVSHQITAHPFIEGDVFHGIVYDRSPEEDLSETLHHQQSDIEDLDRMPDGSSIDTTENEFDTGMANLIFALQNGNQQVISMFQAALHDQIGSNLEALAFKARQSQQFSNFEKTPSFGFYTERENSACKDPDETGDNLTKEKYDDLLDLFMEQCSALVKTEEDRCKLKSFMNVLQKEGEMKLTGLTHPGEIEPKSSHDAPVSLNLTSVHSSMDSFQVESVLGKHETELFEGRTLLKGGVEPRHIPKTTVRKSGLDLPKDPRPCFIGEKSNCIVKIPFPKFAVDLYGEKRVEKMLHLDWDAEFINSRNQSALVQEKDPRMKAVFPIEADLKLIVDATKTLVESLHTSIGNKINKSKETDKIPVSICKTLTSEVTQSIDKTNDKTSTIPVLITPQKEMITRKALDSSKNRNSVLHCVDSKNNLTNDSDKQEKKPCIGIVKPLIEQHKLKDTKPSVGIVKPIRLQTLSMNSETKSKRSTITPSLTDKSSSNVEDLDIEDGEIQVDKGKQVIEKARDKILPSRTNPQKVSIVLDSGPKEGEIRVDEEKLVSEKGKTGSESESQITKCHRNKKGNVENKSCDWNTEIATQPELENVSNIKKVNISLSDVSSNEDGQIDTDLDGSFKEEPPVMKINKRDKRREKSSRQYRKRDRSSSRSSVDSRLSHSSSKHCDGESHDNREKAVRRDSTQSRGRTKFRSPSEEKSNTKHRHRHQTCKDERSYKEFTDRSETSKRYHSVGDEKRKRHKTDEDSQMVMSNWNSYLGDIYSKPTASKMVRSVYGETGANKLPIQDTNLPTTTSVSFENISDEDLLSDADISKEYHEKFGKFKIAVPDTSKTDRLIFSKNSGNSSTEKQYPYLASSKSRRKSWEDQQKQVLEDKKFLEKCKQKILGKSKTFVDQSTKYCPAKQIVSAAYKPEPTSCVSSYNEMHDLKEVGDL